MTPTEMVDLAGMIVGGAMTELDRKAPDYAPDNIVFVDLILTCAEIEQPNPERQLWAFMYKHTSALRRYAMTGSLKSETLLSRAYDTINYAAMMVIWATHSESILRAIALHFQNQRCECPEPMAYPLDDNDLPCPACMVLGWYARHHPDSLTVSTFARDSSDSTPKPPA